jgi:hypothetical protein
VGTRERVAWSLVCLLSVCVAIAGFVAIDQWQEIQDREQAKLKLERAERSLGPVPEVPSSTSLLAATAKKPPEQAVLVRLKLSDQRFGTTHEMDSIHALSAKLEEVIKTKHLGEFDGDEFGDGVCTLYMYGPDADALFAAVEPLLRSSPLAKGASATKRYGNVTDPNAKEVKVTF